MRMIIQPKRILVGVGILALCVGVVVVGVAGIALASYQAAAHNGHVALPQPTPTPSSYGVTTATCDAPGKPACPTPDPGWVQLASNSPSVVLAAMKQTWIFHLDLSDDGDHIHDVSHLGTPVFVHGIAPKGVTIPDFYVLPFMDAHGVITDVGTFELNTQHSALRLQGISSFDGRYPIVRQTVSAAIAAVWSQRHVALKAHAQPYLIFFPIDAYDLETGKVVWNAGGLWPGGPLWLVPGSDGRNYIFGNDGKVYAESEIPMSV